MCSYFHVAPNIFARRKEKKGEEELTWIFYLEMVLPMLIIRKQESVTWSFYWLWHNFFLTSEKALTFLYFQGSFSKMHVLFFCIFTSKGVVRIEAHKAF